MKTAGIPVTFTYGKECFTDYGISIARECDLFVHYQDPLNISEHGDFVDKPLSQSIASFLAVIPKMQHFDINGNEECYVQRLGIQSSFRVVSTRKKLYINVHFGVAIESLFFGVVDNVLVAYPHYAETQYYPREMRITAKALLFHCEEHLPMHVPIKLIESAAWAVVEDFQNKTFDYDYDEVIHAGLEAMLSALGCETTSFCLLAPSKWMDWLFENKEDRTALYNAVFSLVMRPIGTHLLHASISPVPEFHPPLLASSNLQPVPEPPALPKPSLADDDECCICLDNRRTHAAYPCGHYAYCEMCLKNLKECAICRNEIVSSVKIYK
jgi:hypothetical protein